MNYCWYISSHFLIAIFSLTTADLSNITELLADVENLISEFQSYVFALNNNAYFPEQEDINLKASDFGTYDYIIVGGGTAGGVLANRLSEDGSFVLVLEAGPVDPDVAAVPGLGSYFAKSQYDWGYNTTKQKSACFGFQNNQCKYPSGKVLGGSSMINGGMYTRGSPSDYDSWSKMGIQGWSYEDVLPYFKKAEKAKSSFQDIDPRYHGFDGPQIISIPENTPGLTENLIKAFLELGSDQVDYNAATPYGFGRSQTYLNKNMRTSTTYSYIDPVKYRPNLLISLDSLVTKILIENDRAVGVNFAKNKTIFNAIAKKEVIICAGTINSAQILMLSGLGSAKELNKHDIRVIKDLPVGQNLKDHLTYPGIVFRTDNSYYNNTLLETLELWKKGKRPLTNGYGVQLDSYWNLENETNAKAIPDVEIYIVGPLGASSSLGSVIGYNEKYEKSFETLIATSDLIAAISCLHPYSSGEVRLKSKDPRDFPLIDPNYYEDPRDLETMYKGIKKALDLAKTKAFKNLRAEPIPISIPDCDGRYENMSRDWFYCAARYISTTLSHQVGTCRMGSCNKSSVVDSRLKVHGIASLRVADASVIPMPVSAHTNAAVVMIAERAAIFIKEDNC